MSKVVTRGPTSVVRKNKNGTTSTFTKSLAGKWKKSGYSGNARTKSGGLPKSKKF
mgnify:CR=1 FL=1